MCALILFRNLYKFIHFRAKFKRKHLIIVKWYKALELRKVVTQWHVPEVHNSVREQEPVPSFSTGSVNKISTGICNARGSTLTQMGEMTGSQVRRKERSTRIFTVQMRSRSPEQLGAAQCLGATRNWCFSPSCPSGATSSLLLKLEPKAPMPRKLAGVLTVHSTTARPREASTEDAVPGAQQPAGGWSGGSRCRMSSKRETGEEQRQLEKAPGRITARRVETEP